MSLANFEKILRLFVEREGKSIDFVGGEPTLHPQFLQMVRLCVEAKIQVWIYTNLREFGRKPGLADQIFDIGGDITVVGKLNVPNPEDPAPKKVQAKFLGASEEAVDEMWQGLLNLLAAGFPNGRVGIENLIRGINIDFAPQVYEVGLQMGFFVDLEIPTCPFSVRIDSFQQWLKLFPTKKQILTCIREVAEVNERYGISPYIPMMPHLTGRNPEGVGMGCVAFKQGALLTEADGRIRMCTSGIPLLDEFDRQLNILTNPLEVIFSHPSLIARRQSCKQENIQSGPCAKCEYWQYCLGGCAALREVLGLVFDSYPLCYMHDWTTKEKLLKLFRKAEGN